MTKDLTVFELLLRGVRASLATTEPAPFLEARDALVAEVPPGDPTVDLLRDHPPAEGLRRIAAYLDGDADMPTAAWACISVALQLEPEDIAVHKTRGLIAMSNLKPEAAKASFRRAAAGGDPHADLLRTYCSLIYPAATFAPIRFPASPPPGTPEPAAAIAQPLDAVRRQIGVYVTRLQQLRQRLREGRKDEPASWMVPDLSHVLPDGPLDLEPAEQLDRLLPLGTQHAARENWTALSWLCWLIGLDDVALPNTLQPRPEVAACRGWAEFALWRTRDQQMSGGAVAQQSALPGLPWRSGDVADLPRPVAGVAARDAAELQALARWLTDGKVASPFSDGLRDS